MQKDLSITKDLVPRLEEIVGVKNIITKPNKIVAFAKGYRFGQGRALAVLLPQTLYCLWRSLETLVQHDVIIIMQAANTGLTGGSTPDGDDYDRDVVIINTMHIKQNQIQPINEAKQVVCLPGSTLNQLEKVLVEYGREPHSVIGSSCIGASVLGGVCNNSGGMLVQRGPAYTEMSLFAQINAQGELQLVNHLGINLGSTPKEILTNLQQANYTHSDIINDETIKGHDHNYCNHVRDVKSQTPARFNADPNRLYEASGCAGKVIVFAVRLDTFSKAKQTKVFYLGTNKPEKLAQVRKDILQNFKNLPVSGEYMHRSAFDLSAKYSKDIYWVVKKLGTDRLPLMFSLKRRFDSFAKKISFLPKNPSDKIMQLVSNILPNHLPKELRNYRDLYEHHLALQMSDDGIDEAREYLTKFFASDECDFIECDQKLGQVVLLHRFSVGNSSIRYQAIHSDKVESIMAIDVALRRNDYEYFRALPQEIEQYIETKMCCGHFLCNVFHQDYLLKKGVNVQEIEDKIHALLDEVDAQYPAEHNVGHMYEAKIDLRDFYKKLDPTNSLNPGIGKTSKLKNWQ